MIAHFHQKGKRQLHQRKNNQKRWSDFVGNNKSVQVAENDLQNRMIIWYILLYTR